MTGGADVQKQIRARYAEEAASCSNLSCGNNLEALAVTEGETILDLGCGRGADTLEAARRTGPNGRAVGLDLTREMVVKATENALAAGFTNASFVRGDIESLPFGDETFDAVISNCVINHARDKTRAYSEIFRVLKPSGRFIVSDAVTKEPLPASVKNDPEAWAQCFGGAVTEEAYLDSIRSAGFQSVDILKRRDYVKNGYDFISLTIKAVKIANPAKGGPS